VDIRNAAGAPRESNEVADREATDHAKKERDRDKRYRKNYDIGLALYNAIGEDQGWRCGACGIHQSELDARLNVDHEHFKITTVRGDGGWYAETTVRDQHLSKWGKTQAESKRNLKAVALRLSVRGLLCPGRYKGCNRLLGRVDDIKRLEGFLAYLKNPPAHKLIS
jgi:hypothetical protein